MTDRDPAAAVAALRAKLGSRRPKIAIVLGSGLGPFADTPEKAISIPYADLPGWPAGPAVSGHGKRLVVGTIGGVEVACLAGRAHYYEQGDAKAMMVPIASLKAIGVETLLLTNAAGSMRPEVGPGSVVLLTDHINYSGMNPLIGVQGDERFVAMKDAYDPGIRAVFHRVAKANGITLPEGVYIWYSGPAFETPAEIRALRILGADVVGMSTAPEVVLARYYKLRVGALSAITNLAAGMSDEKLSHEHTQEQAKKAAGALSTLLVGAIAELGHG
jgi:purine-nucleoside phosphorylase